MEEALTDSPNGRRRMERHSRNLTRGPNELRDSCQRADAADGIRPRLVGKVLGRQKWCSSIPSRCFDSNMPKDIIHKKPLEHPPRAAGAEVGAGESVTQTHEARGSWLTLIRR